MTRAVLLLTQGLHLLGNRGSKVCICQRRHSNSKGGEHETAEKHFYIEEVQGGAGPLHRLQPSTCGGGGGTLMDR